MTNNDFLQTGIIVGCFAIPQLEKIMADTNKIADLCYTASFAFDRLAEISMQVHDLERESIKTPITVENVEQNVIKFNKELDDVPRMRPASRTFVPRRSTFTRPLDSYSYGHHYQMPSSYRLMPNSNPTAKTFNMRNEQVNTSSNSSIMYRKRPSTETFDNPNEAKQVKGIKWVAATGQDVENSGLNIVANLAKSTVNTGNLARREYSIGTAHSSSQQSARQLPSNSNYNAFNSNNNDNRRILPKPKPLSPVRNNRPANSINVPQPPKKVFVNEDEAAVHSLMQAFNENNESESSGVEY